LPTPRSPARYVTRVLDQVKAERGLPKVIRTDNGPEFAARTMQIWAAKNGVELQFACLTQLSARQRAAAIRARIEATVVRRAAQVMVKVTGEGAA
jgi:hypothetical protein